MLDVDGDDTRRAERRERRGKAALGRAAVEPTPLEHTLANDESEAIRDIRRRRGGIPSIGFIAAKDQAIECIGQRCCMTFT